MDKGVEKVLKKLGEFEGNMNSNFDNLERRMKQSRRLFLAVVLVLCCISIIAPYV